MKHIVLLILFVFVLEGCQEDSIKNNQIEAAKIDTVVRRMSDIMVHDVTNPPLAARFFGYAFLAGYEIVSQNNDSIKSLNGILNEYPQINKPDLATYDYQLASLLATINVASAMQPSGDWLNSLKEKLLSEASDGFDQATIKGSVDYAEIISKEILNYAKNDGYTGFSKFPRYTPVEGDGYWFPTPPGYIAAIEPYFNRLRPFFLDSGTQFVPPPPVPFNPDESSAFFASMDSVYKAGNQLTQEEKEIAAFWDCNPFALENRGHLRVGIKKISPGAHWMGITGVACTQNKMAFDSSMMVHAIVALTLTDAFISCWDEKYRSNRIRPETAIRRYIDPEWKPFLQTPPFPEYTSGHSVVSGASSEVLTYFLGDSFAYRDSVEQDFGLPAREFESFRDAAEEAAVSRYYGGIHYMDANINGLGQGQMIGKRVLSIYLESK